MADLRELYQEVILEHSKAPRNYRELATASHRAEGYNPLCGDHFTVYLSVEGDSIRDISFQGFGCAISKASASMMTQSVKGKTRAEAETLFDRFHKLVTGHGCFFRRLRISGAGQVRHAGVARITRCDARETGDSVDGVVREGSSI